MFDSIISFKKKINLKVCSNILLNELRPRAYQILRNLHVKKSRIRETKHLSTDVESSTDTTVGWTKNTQKPNFFEKWKKSSKTQKLKNI